MHPLLDAEIANRVLSARVRGAGVARLPRWRTSLLSSLMTAISPARLSSQRNSHRLRSTASPTTSSSEKASSCNFGTQRRATPPTMSSPTSFRSCDTVAPILATLGASRRAGSTTHRKTFRLAWGVCRGGTLMRRALGSKVLESRCYREESVGVLHVSRHGGFLGLMRVVACVSALRTCGLAFPVFGCEWRGGYGRTLSAR